MVTPEPQRQQCAGTGRQASCPGGSYVSWPSLWPDLIARWLWLCDRSTTMDGSGWFSGMNQTPYTGSPAASMTYWRPWRSWYTERQTPSTNSASATCVSISWNPTAGGVLHALTAGHKALHSATPGPAPARARRATGRGSGPAASAPSHEREVARSQGGGPRQVLG
jgi:hypothetical protein